MLPVAESTRARILREALNLFSIRGYDPVPVRDIARAVGIKESSLYNHFRNKQDIFDSIVDEYTARWREFFARLQLPGAASGFTVDAGTISQYVDMTPEQFSGMAALIFDHYFLDETNVQLRRLLTIEQYRSPSLARLFRDLSFDESIAFQASLFGALIAAGCFRAADPYVLALEFFAPIFLIFYKFDHEPESLAQARSLFLRHIRHFNETYGIQRHAE